MEACKRLQTVECCHRERCLSSAPDSELHCRIAWKMNFYFTKIDLTNAFWQVPLNPTDVPKTTITTPFCSFQFLHMNYGLINSSETFQRFIDTVLDDLKTEGKNPGHIWCYTHIDDILLSSRNETEHLEELEVLFKRFERHCLKINANKCEFVKQ